MAFWSWRGSRAAELADLGLAPQEAAEPGNLEPIRIFTVSGEYAGTIDSHGQRVTDLLNTQPAILIRLNESGTRGEWVSVDRDTILVVAPPPFVSQRRIHRQHRSVQIKVGDWVVTGVAHTAPMGGLNPTHLRSGQHFLPMTNVRIVRADGTADGEQFAVAIVNVSNVAELRELSLA